MGALYVISLLDGKVEEELQDVYDISKPSENLKINY